MLAQNPVSAFRFLGALCVLSLFAVSSAAHEGHADAAATASALVASGTVTELRIDNHITAESSRYLGLRLDDGQSFALIGPAASALEKGARIEATGFVAGQSFRVTSVAAIAPAPKSATVAAEPSAILSGTLAIYHKDFFDQGRGEYGLVIRSSTDKTVRLTVAVIPDVLQPGMSIVAEGALAATGSELETSSITILAAAPPTSNDIAAAPVTNNVLVVPIKFTDSAADPFTVAAITTEFQGQVTSYYNEVSYGQQLLNVTVASSGGGWLNAGVATPANCDFNTVGSLGSAAASAAGYNPNNYQNVYYVMSPNNTCGWAGLAYVGWGFAWSNGVNALWVYGHELGHNFGLLHSGSLSCSGQVIGGTCSVSEYGDPFDVMGNIRQGHFNSMQKAKLNWIPGTSVKQHISGTQTYQLSPIENGGQSTYAVTIQAPAPSTRKYWVEFRQPIGFDSPISGLPNLGAQIRVSGPSLEYGCGSCDDTELLDTTPGSNAGNGGFDDAALLAGQTYSDSYGISVHVISATTSTLTLSVTAPGATPPPSLAGAVSRKTHGAAGTFDMPLSLVATNPTTEPRIGPVQTLVFDFGKPITAATVAVTEGVATAAAPTFSGNTVVVTLTGVANKQYVTVALSNVSSADGGTAGTASVRVGYLAGDVNQNRVVSVADEALINASLARAVTSANYLQDINASGTLTVADKAIANSALATALPAP